MVSRDDAAELLLRTLDDLELDVDEVGERRYMTMLAGEWKRTIPVLFHLDERSLHTTTLLAGVPDEGHQEVYRILLQHNQRPLPVHFALDDEGELLLVGSIPYGLLDDSALDELLGAILDRCDTVFNRVLRVGFASYIEHEQRWRSSRGQAPNPVSAAP